MQQIKLKCLVIREVDFSEHDRYITVLTEHGRKLEVLCRGVRRKNKAGAAAALLTQPASFAGASSASSNAMGNFPSTMRS